MAVQEIFDALNTRIKTPYFGYALLSFFALNWRALFTLATTKGTPDERLLAFDSHTNVWTLLVLPLLIGGAISIISPWIKYWFGSLSKKPLELINNLQLDVEHTRVIREAELEKTRAEMFATREQELIDRAKRDESVGQLEDREAQDRLHDQDRIFTQRT